MASTQPLPDGVPSTEREHPDAFALDRATPIEIVRRMAREERRSVRALERAAEDVAWLAERAAQALAAGGALVFCGAGTSGRLGVCEAAECPPTFRSRPEQVRALIAGGQAALMRAIEGAEDDAEAGRRAVREDGLGRGDVLLGISASGGAPFVRAALEAARARGACTALLTCNVAFDHAALDVDRVIVLDVGPEVLAGSSRLKAGTATKLALNALTTTAFSLLGKVYGQLMVDVHATNHKLRARAIRLVRRLGGVSPARAQALLEQVDWRVKDAVVMARLKLGPEAAAARLAAAAGRLREVIG